MARDDAFPTFAQRTGSHDAGGEFWKDIRRPPAGRGARKGGRFSKDCKLCCFLSEVPACKVREDDARCDGVWLDVLAAGRLWRLFLPAGVPCRACFAVDDGRCSGVFAVGTWWVCLGSRD